MQRYFISEQEFKQNIILSDDVFHISRVMRSKTLDKIIVCFDAKAYLVEIKSITDSAVEFQIINEIETSSELQTKITLVQGMPKGDKLEDIIMHSTELGLSSLIVCQMKRSIVKFDEKKINAKLIRYQKIAKEAAEQAHRNVVPHITIERLKDIDLTDYDLCLLLDEDEARKDSPNTIKSTLINKYNNILFVVGPEGGIDSQERDYLISHGFVPISLGKRILRTQTASLAFLSVLAYYIEEVN